MIGSWRVAAGALVALLFTYWLMPRAMVWAIRVGLVDLPGGRKIHRTPTPLAGGPVLFVAVLVTTFVLSTGAATLAGIDDGGIWGGGRDLRGVPVLLGWAFPLSCLVAFLVGLADDWVKSRGGELPAAAKLAGQVVAAGLFVWGGDITINYVSNPFGPGIVYLSNWWDYAVTVLWLVGMTNAVNFLDGLDGLAGGTVAVATFTLMVVALALGAVLPGVWAAAILGACLGFLRYNFPNARSFMGDSGSNFLGFTLAALSLLGYFKTATLAGLVVPLFALGLPVLNGFFVVIRRLLLHRPIHAADREHAFDVLRRRGWNNVETVLIFLLLAMALSAAGMGLALRPGALAP